jgi:hypothetical protein
MSRCSQSLGTTGALTNVDKMLNTELLRGIQQENAVEKLKIIALLKKEVQSLRSISITYIRGVSARFTRIANKYNIKIVFKTSHALRKSLIRTRPKRAPQKAAAFSIVFPGNVAGAKLGKQADRGP